MPVVQEWYGASISVSADLPLLRPHGQKGYLTWDFGGGSGIRTHGTREGLDGFQDRSIRPLWHPSWSGIRADRSEPVGSPLAGPHVTGGERGI